MAVTQSWQAGSLISGPTQGWGGGSLIGGGGGGVTRVIGAVST